MQECDGACLCCSRGRRHGRCFSRRAEDPKDIVAAQIRAQGYKCDSPQSAEQDAQASKPDEAVWVLQCEGASYRVRLVPDMAAKVERIDKSKENGQRGL